MTGETTRGEMPRGEITRERLRFAATAFLWSALAGSVVTGVLYARARLHASRRNLVDLDVWTVAERPGWSRLGDLLEVRGASGLAGRKLPLFDRDAATDVRDRIAATPRVRRVVAIRRRVPDRIEVFLELRRPVAAVWLGGEAGGYVEVDEEGVALGPPTAARPHREGAPLRVITGPAGEAPGPGGVFPDDVLAGVGLAVALGRVGTPADRELLALLDEIDVSNDRGRVDARRSEVLLRARPAGPHTLPATLCVVEWGRTGSRAGEADASSKAVHLVEALRLFPRLEGLDRVRVAFADLVVVPTDGTGPGSRWLPSVPSDDLWR